MIDKEFTEWISRVGWPYTVCEITTDGKLKTEYIVLTISATWQLRKQFEYERSIRHYFISP